MQQDPISFGTIDDQEIIVRAAFDPRSGNAKTGNIKAAIIPKEDLLSGSFSVWRLEPLGISCSELIERLDVVPNQLLFALCGLPASEIRAVKAGTARALSVVDECECDAQGNKHPAHAHVAICKSLTKQGLHKDHPDFEQARTELHAKFKRSPIWVAWQSKPAP
ncbi:hypothetical protein [Sphingopyxis kveilinensis]|uniref:hypothetical protein n=1 Tax=Sphingopyxis kveilinensis TaxID=3114367 RepID=UPI0030CD2F5A